MSLRRVGAIARRIAAQFRRDHRSLALLIGAPLIVLALLGWVIRDQKPPETRLGVVDGGGATSVIAAQALRRAAVADGLPVVDVESDEASGRAAVRDDRADVVVVLPANLGSGGAVRVITLGEVAGDDAARLQAVVGVLGDALSSARGGVVPRIEHATVYGSADADLLDTFAPALIGFFGFFFVFILTGISFLRERIGGTLERLLASPVRRGEIVAGYSLGFGIFATLQVTVILLFALGALTVPALGPVSSFTVGLGISSAGSPLLAFLVVVLAAIGAVNLAIFVSTFARSELQVIQFIPVIVVPQALLCGIFWSVSSLPDVLQPIARVMPMTYAVDGLRAVLIRGADLGNSSLQLDLAVLAAAAVVFVALGGATIRREIV
jgi:ABC-2 type transport system permease protein